MYESGCSGRVHQDHPEGWDGEGGGREVQDGEHMYTHGWFMSVYGRNHYNIVISFQLKEIIIFLNPEGVLHFKSTWISVSYVLCTQ